MKLLKTIKQENTIVYLNSLSGAISAFVQYWLLVQFLVCLFAFSIDFIFICRSWDKKTISGERISGKQEANFTMCKFAPGIHFTLR